MIAINSASEAELQELRGIGPQRARRIVEHRASMGPITDLRGLSAASGLSLPQAYALDANIDWRAKHAFSWYSAIPVLSFAATLLLFVNAAAQLGVARTSPAESLLVAILGLVVVTCGLALVQQILSYLGKPVIRPLLIPTSSAALVLLGALLIASRWLDVGVILEQQLQAALLLLVIIASMALLLLGPGWHLAWNQPNSRLALQQLAPGIYCYELIQIPLGLAALSFVQLSSDSFHLAHLYALWMGVMLAVNGLEQLRQRCSYFSMLAAGELHWLVFLGHSASPAGYRRRLLQALGALQLLLALCLMLLGGRGFVV